MLYLYSISIALSCISLIFLFIRVLVNKNNIKSMGGKYSWKVFITLMIIGLIPILNIVLAISIAYVSILMKNENFIKLINE
ncbi:hypothetical protein [Clostridium saccharobutylicum]|uniref:Uncharacterized protein n=1 Tax=Clostridium saccharobutylicum TaxID=169679 RepID=A0A1S8MY67_CLOSA|nr:hypothetical protein [Clostridium saccharobutylicum]OOM09127.1 hypothetical protein CLOSAC_34070 [Clostridium saccharobutylicum]